MSRLEALVPLVQARREAEAARRRAIAALHAGIVAAREDRWPITQIMAATGYTRPTISGILAKARQSGGQS